MLKNFLAIFNKGEPSSKSTSQESSIRVGGPSITDTARDQSRLDGLFVSAGEAFDRGDSITALDHYLSLLKLAPDHAKAHVMAGFLFQQRANLSQAKHHLDAAVGLNPNLADAYFLRGQVAASEGDMNMMQQAFRTSLGIEARQEQIYLPLVMALFQAKELDQALVYVKQGLSNFPSNAALWNCLGNLHFSRKEMEAAKGAYQEARDLIEFDAGIEYNYAIACAIAGHYQDALAAVERILEREPRHVFARFQRGVLRLQQGDFAGGWTDLESRWELPTLQGVRFQSSKPQWDGSQDLKGKTILLLSEQGFGDTLQFCRFIPFLAARGARVIFVTFGPLWELMQQIPGVAHLLNESDALPSYDYYCELMSLPRALKLTLDSIPSQHHYLVAPLNAAQKWNAILPKKERLRVGYVWCGNPQHATDSYRSIPYDEARIAFKFDAQFIVLLKELQNAEKDDICGLQNVAFYGDQMQSFSDTAGLIEQVDVVVTVDTSVAHLAGAMGKRCIVLLSYHSDWRWLLERDDSPWYPSVSLVRQKRGQTWRELVESVCRDQLGLRLKEPTA